MTELAANSSMFSSENDKLTSWKNEPNLLALKQDFEASKTSHDTQVAQINKWVDLNEVKGKEKPKKLPGRSAVQPKLIRRQAEWRYSALTEPFLGSDKLFEVKPVSHEDKAGAVQNEVLLNHQFRTAVDRVPFIDEYVRTVVDEGTAILRVGWERVTKKTKKTFPVFVHYRITDEEQLLAFKQRLDQRAQDYRGFDETADDAVKSAMEVFDEQQIPTRAEQTGEEEREVEEVILNRPTLEILNFENVYIDPSCGGKLDKAMFLIYSFETSKSELLKDGRYKNLDKIDWEAAGPIQSEHHTSSSSDSTFQFRDAVRKRIVAYEYWGFYDVSGTGELKPIVATWIGNTIIRMEENPYPDGKLPFVLVPYLPKKRSVYGETDAELLEDNQKILGAVTRGMIDLLGRSANGQQGMAKGMLDPLNRRRFDAGLNYEFNPTQHPNNGIIDHKYPELPRSALEITTMVNQEAEAMSGVKSFSGGMSGEAYGKVAAGIRGMLDAASKREMAILRRLSRGLVEVGKKFISMNGLFLSEQEVVRVTNDTFVTVKREELAGNFDLIVDISTAEVDDAQASDLAFMLQTMGPNMDFSMTQMILSEIARLKRMPDLAKRISSFKPEPDPLDQKKKELEIAELEAKIDEIRARSELARAKAAEANATKEQKDLDYLEQADGIKHERDMERQQGQAQGNQDLQVTKALLAPEKENERKPPVEAAIGWNSLSNKQPGTVSPAPVDTMGARDALAELDPSFSLGSGYYDPSLDPATNPGINL